MGIFSRNKRKQRPSPPKQSARRLISPPDSWLVELDVGQGSPRLHHARTFGTKGMFLVVPAGTNSDILAKVVKNLVGHVAEGSLMDRNKAWARGTRALAQNLGRVGSTVRPDGLSLHVGRSLAPVLLVLLLSVLFIDPVLLLIVAVEVLGAAVVEKGKGGAVLLAVTKEHAVLVDIYLGGVPRTQDEMECC